MFKPASAEHRSDRVHRAPCGPNYAAGPSEEAHSLLALSPALTLLYSFVLVSLPFGQFDQPPSRGVVSGGPVALGKGPPLSLDAQVRDTRAITSEEGGTVGYVLSCFSP